MWSLRDRDRLRRTFTAISEAASVASFVVMAAPLAVALAGTAAAIALGHRFVATFLVGAAVMLIVVVLILLFPLKSSIRRLVYGFRLRAVTITLVIDAGGPGRHDRQVRLLPRIIRTGIRRIPDRYCQPGPRGATKRHLSHTPRLIEGDGQVLGPIWDAMSQCWVYEIDLGAAQSAGAEPPISLEQRLDFRGESYHPQLQRTILDPTDFLSLRLKVPSNYWPIVAYGEEVLPAERPRRLEAALDAEHGEVRLDVTCPNFGSIYRLRWTAVGKLERADPQFADAEAPNA